MTQQNNFVGYVPHRGKLNVVKTNTNQFIGFVEITALEDPTNGRLSNGFGKVQFMYFKDYIVEDGHPVFKDFEVDKNNVCNFHIAFMRLPPQLDYVLIDENGNEKHSMPVEKMYFGLTLLNLHEENDTESLASKFFIPPNHHYDTAASRLEDDTSIGGKHGCESFIGFGNQRVPLFNQKDEERNEMKYLLMLLGTDNTIGFCSMNSDVLQERVNRIIHAQKEDDKTINKIKVLGVRNDSPKVYFVENFTDNYGIHLIEDEEDGWELGNYEIRPYKMSESGTQIVDATEVNIEAVPI